VPNIEGLLHDSIKIFHVQSIHLQNDKKLYFASDFHLGFPDHATSLARERKIVAWLESIKHDAQVIFLVGDLFDFWFEYKNVIPKGFVRLQGKLAELSDSGIEIMIFPGNHDIWMFDYFTKEMGIKVYREPQEFSVISNTKTTTFYIAHGDGLGPGDGGYKILKRIFDNKFCQWAFSWLHPHVGIGLANFWSGSRKANARIEKELDFRGEGEWLWAYSKEQEIIKHHDFYIFGHRHLLLDLPVGTSSRYINLGEWFYEMEQSCHYTFFDGNELTVRQFNNN
jgi:UDP-2,3-diacylglucosamine hydrolase